MANYTITQLKSVGVAPATSSNTGAPSQDVCLEYFFDGSKRSTVATDTVDIFEIPAYAMFFADSAAVTVVSPGTGGAATIGVTIGAAAAAGTAVTGLTAWAADAAAGTKLVKLSTAAQNNASSASANFVKLQFSSFGVGTGKYRVRVMGRLLEAPSAALAG
jgi:hypothetical protein